MAAPIRLQGKISWFGGPNDSTDSGHTASGGTTREPGIAVFNHATLGGYWRVKLPNGRSTVVKQTDIGPAPWTGRKLDFTYSLLPQLGYNEHSFPTDAQATAEYLGKSGGAGAGAGLPSPVAGGGGEGEGSSPAAIAALVQQMMGAGKPAGPTITPLAAPAQSAAPALPEGFKLPAEQAAAPAKSDPTALLTALSALQGQVPGGAGGAAGAPGGSGAYVSPLGSSFTRGRVDMGIDFSGAPGAPIRAIGNAKVLGVQPDWYKGQPYVSYQLLDGPQKGKVVYVAEQITPSVKAGDVVRAGQPIGVYAPHGTGIETGFGTPSGRTLAQATTGYHEGQATPAGQQFLRLLQSLGVK